MLPTYSDMPATSTFTASTADKPSTGELSCVLFIRDDSTMHREMSVLMPGDAACKAERRAADGDSGQPK